MICLHPNDHQIEGSVLKPKSFLEIKGTPVIINWMNRLFRTMLATPRTLGEIDWRRFFLSFFLLLPSLHLRRVCVCVCVCNARAEEEEEVWKHPPGRRRVLFYIQTLMNIFLNLKTFLFFAGSSPYRVPPVINFDKKPINLLRFFKKKLSETTLTFLIHLSTWTYMTWIGAPFIEIIIRVRVWWSAGLRFLLPCSRCRH